MDARQNISYSLTPWNLLLGFLHLSSHTIPQRTINVCICTSVFYCTCVVYHMCSTVYSAHMEPTLQAAGPLPRCLFRSLSLLLLIFLLSFPFSSLSLLHFPSLFSFVLLRSTLSLLLIFSVSAFYFLPLSPSPFLPFTTLRLVHMPPPLPPVLFSLVSNHTRLEPAQLCSSTHGNHLKVLCWSLPCFSALRSLTFLPFPFPRSCSFLPLCSLYSTL